jgi:DNA-binding CsgD family transcriptional regulator
LLDLDEFCECLLRSLREAVPAEWCALDEVPADLPRTISLSDPPIPPEMHQIHQTFARLASQNPIAAHFLRTHEGRATRFSDLLTRRELHRLEIYREVYGPLGVEYQIAFTLPSGSERVLGVALSRGHRDFTAYERDLLNLSRPYLIQIYRNALTHTRPKAPRIDLANLRAQGLTEREADVLGLLATGHSAREAAATLEISPRTVQKHLEHCYRKLGVSTRTQATRIAWLATGNNRPS